MLARAPFRPRRRNASRPAEKSAPGFLQWLRGRSCLIDNADCAGRMEACHVDYAGDKGIGTKVADRYAVPMCSHHHAEQHRGVETFEVKYSVDLLARSRDYFDAWPGKRAWLQRLVDMVDG